METLLNGPRKHTISLLVANKPGVLIRIALVFARRGYNIDSLVVSASKDPTFSVMNIVAIGDAKVLDQIIKQLNKLVDVVSARDRTDEDTIQRELVLFKMGTSGKERMEVLTVAHAIGCASIDVGESHVILQLEGPSEALDAATKVLEPYGILEVVRTGKVLMSRSTDLTT